MTKKPSLALLFYLIFLMGTCFAQKEVAVTIDDLPFVGEGKNFHLNMIIDALKNGEIPATGFVIAGKIREANWPMLHKFREAGLNLGNHTLTHINLNRTAPDVYIREIEKADDILKPIISQPKFFRYPYMAMGSGQKKQQILDYLSEKKYRIAPITIDSRDFVFNQLLLSIPVNDRRSFLPALKKCYLEYIRQQTLNAEERSRLARKPNQPQILLIHANLLNAYVLPDIIHFYKKNGYDFISLENALNISTKRARLADRHQDIRKEPSAVDSFTAWNFFTKQA